MMAVDAEAHGRRVRHLTEVQVPERVAHVRVKDDEVLLADVMVSTDLLRST
jgi:hypothetical protein